MLLDRERDRRSAPAGRPTHGPDDPPGVVCAVCGHQVTDERARMEASGSHEHTFVNPAGFVHVVGCWREAPGAVEVGPVETAFSWFPGWSWQIVACGRCRAHLGWRYRNAAETFWGLITRALRVQE